MDGQGADMKVIQLTQGKVALVSDEDYEDLSRYKWHAQQSRRTWYAYRAITVSRGKKQRIAMHRAILGVEDDAQVDHIDGDGLNNTRENLRPCSRGENMHNRGKNGNNTSGFKCVYFDKRSGKWQAQIRIGGRNKSFGLHDNAIDAARAYDNAARELHGEFAKFNLK